MAVFKTKGPRRLYLTRLRERVNFDASGVFHTEDPDLIHALSRHRNVIALSDEGEPILRSKEDPGPGMPPTPTVIDEEREKLLIAAAEHGLKVDGDPDQFGDNQDLHSAIDWPEQTPETCEHPYTTSNEDGEVHCDDCGTLLSQPGDGDDEEFDPDDAEPEPDEDVDEVHARLPMVAHREHSRDELDVMAKGHGLDPAAYGNKLAVANAINNARGF